MSASIDRSIRQAEKYDRLGEVDAARAVIEKEIGRYPNNPRLQVMAERFAASSNLKTMILKGCPQMCLQS